jgi:hypothetical protein
MRNLTETEGWHDRPVRDLRPVTDRERVDALAFADSAKADYPPLTHWQDYSLAGFLLADGTLLDFSCGGGTRAVDHRTVVQYLRAVPYYRNFEEKNPRVTRTDLMYRWMERANAVRVTGSQSAVVLSLPPSKRRAYHWLCTPETSTRFCRPFPAYDVLTSILAAAVRHVGKDNVGIGWRGRVVYAHKGLRALFAEAQQQVLHARLRPAPKKRGGAAEVA